ncbi:EpsG family protein [Anaeromyxobacter terrae]|uniref:EpsG family protein n=1 Tax=Anaeromyxobacter terrae TaxID=2925406 RepID=UPI001F56EE8F|nr:EpsG family protein [Anaeromyxobacter sp. SG22]
MLLSHVILAVLGGVALVVAALRAVAHLHVSENEEGAWVVDRLAAGLLVVMLVLLAFRSLSFGVDTAAYAEMFHAYCHGDALRDMDGGFRLSALLLNGAMLGACDVRMLCAAWAVIVTMGILLATGAAQDKSRFTALLLVSMVGIELTTNALRQGFSVGLAIAAVSHWPTRRVAAVAFGAGAVALHASAALVFVGLAAATLPWARFLAVLGAACAVVAISLKFEPTFVADVVPLQRLLYYVEKYQGLEGDEIWVRVLSFSSTLLTMVAALLAMPTQQLRLQLLKDERFLSAVRLAATCLPFLVIPYFGYRYVYGVFPIVLWRVLAPANESRAVGARAFAWVLLSNAVVLLGWSLGSHYMRSVPFFE